MYNKKKIINDPLYGFIGIPSEIVFDLVSHPWLGRLRQIRQLGLTHLVYPGAVHTRFHHALGALHLANLSIETLRAKDIDVLPDEADGLRLALLLHDLGHSPFSHSLEGILVPGLSHETVTEMAMQRLNNAHGGALETALAIFNGSHPKAHLHQLVSGQLDLDRLDYLNRDSFYTGVSEGVVSYDRIIKMLHVCNGELVLEEKALYSIEKFLIARRLMYWQVYLHKTVIASEKLLQKIIQRAKYLFTNGRELFCSPSLRIFLLLDMNAAMFMSHPEYFTHFLALDDTDVWSAIKVWTAHSDYILSTLCNALVNRNLFHIHLQKDPINPEWIAQKEKEVLAHLPIAKEDLSYFVFTGTAKNQAYDGGLDHIRLLQRGGRVLSFLELSDFFHSADLARPIEKQYLCSFRF